MLTEEQTQGDGRSFIVTNLAAMINYFLGAETNNPDFARPT